MRVSRVIYLFIFLLVTLTSFAQSKDSSKPNILFIAIDDMNDWTGFLGGHPQTITPNLDRVSELGVNFTNAHCSAPGCSPSRNSLLYGVEPFNSGLYPFYDEGIHEGLKEKYVSLPTLLKNNGYLTFGSGKIHHGSKSDKAEWTDYHKPKKFKKKFREGEGYVKGKNAKYSFRPTLNPDEEHMDHQFASYGVEKLKEKHDKPFFLAVGIVKPHLPFDAPARFFDALPKEVSSPPFLENDADDIPKAARDLMKKGEFNHYKSKNAWNDVRRAYLACISWADYNIGRVIDALEQSEYADNTIVVIWSDHGFHLGEKMTFKKFTLWEEATRVPFIIYDTRDKGKKIKSYKEAVSLINIYPTIAELAGVKLPEYVDGESLLPVLKDQSTKLAKPTITSWGRGNYAVRTEKYRYIRYYDGSEELYFHDEDPNEWKNLAKDPKFATIKNELIKSLPKHEEKLVEDFINPWSVEGADKAKYMKKK